MTSPKGAPLVEGLYADYVALVEELAASPSGLAAVNRTYGKHLVVAAASSLEDYVKESIPEMFARRGNDQLRAFVASAVFARGYHTLFDWKSTSAQKFFASFGAVCAAGFKVALRDDDDLKTEHDAFMQLGQLRNELVHNDFASKSIDQTPAEVIGKYRLGVLFVARFEELIHAGA